MSLAFSVSDVIPAVPQAIYDAWLDSAGHAAMTGGKPATCSAAVGGAFTVTFTIALVAEPPWLSIARAVRAYVPAGVLFHMKA